MSPVNGIGYKVNTLGGDYTPPDAKASEVEEGLNNFFESPLDGEDTPTPTSNSNPLNDYTCGEIADGSYTSGADAEMDSWLESFPPELETIVAGNPEAINYFDVIAERYEKAKVDLTNLKLSYEQALDSGTLSGAEAKVLSDRLSLCDQAIARCSAELDKVAKQKENLSAIFYQEQKTAKDLNNDNWIGRPRVEGSFYCHYNDDGKLVLIDWQTKKPVQSPLLDPEYQPALTSNDSLQMIDSSIAFGYDPTEDPSTASDLFLRMTEAALSGNSNNFNAEIDVGIPEYIWVKRNPEGFAEGIYQETYDSEMSEWKMDTYSEGWVQDASGIHQTPPDDLSKFAQVQVANAVIISKECGTVDGDPSAKLYNHFIELRDKDDKLIMRIRIEGIEGSSLDHPSKQTLAGSGSQYIAPSSVGFALHDSDRASPINVDAGNFISTSRHLVSDPSQLGVSAPSGADPKAANAFNENIGQFTQEDYTYYKWDGSAYVAETKEFEYSGYTSCYVGPADEPNPEDALGQSTYRTGVFITGLRGNFQLSNANDFVKCRGVNDYSDYAKEHMPDSLKEITKDDSYYSNFVECGGGNDAVFCGGGDNYIREAAFVWIEDAKAKDENFIQLKKQPIIGAGTTNATKAPNVKNFVHIEGGDNKILNPDETSMKSYAGDTEEEADAAVASYEDDYYEVLDGGTAQYGFQDADVLDSDNSGWMGGEVSEDMITTLWDDAYNAWLDDFTKVPELDDIDPNMNWDEVMGASSEMDEEMNGFFDEMFGELNEFSGEMQETVG